MTSIPAFSVNNRVLVNLFMATILVGGVYSGLTLIREMFPESRPNRILVSTAYPGASPAEIEKGITLKLEEQIKDIEGVEKIRSIVTEGSSTILVELFSGFDEIDRAVNDVKAAIDTIPPEDFPEEALETQVAEFEPRFPVISVSLYGDLDDRTLKTIGERLRNDLLELPEITDVVLTGTRKDEISVEVRPDKLVEFGLSFMQVAEAIAASNLDLPGGLIRTTGANVSVRTLGEKDRGHELYDIVIRNDPGGRAVTLRDVANIVDGFEDVEIAGRFNAKPAVSATVYKTEEQDAIAIASMVKALVAGKMGDPLPTTWGQRLSARLLGSDPIGDIHERAARDPYPPGISAQTHNDLSQFIEGRLDLLKRNGRWGLVLVFLSLLVFLHWRVAFWVMMGLILAITGSLIVMKMIGLSLNLITMGGLIIVLGLLVDDAIIVSEHVFSKVEAGVEPKLAAITGTEEVTWPVVCAIITTVVAFFPLRFIKGQIGDWMGVLPVVACVALAVSLVEALTILPSHLAHSLRPTAVRVRETHGPSNGLLRSLHRRARTLQYGLLMDRFRTIYDAILRKAVAYRYVTIGALTACMLIALGAVNGGHVPFVFLQKMDSEGVIANLQMGVGAPMEQTRKATAVVEHAVLQLDELKSMYTLIGAQLDDEGTRSPLQSHLSQLFLELEQLENRERSSDAIVQELRDKTLDIPGVEKLSFTSVHGGPGGAAIHLEISGERVEDLVAVADNVKSRLAEFAGVFDIMDDFD
ncbi:MAG: efflux RND transporter permease subunit, partial [Phycisphaerae bacterium]